MTELEALFWDWWRDVRIGEDHRGDVRLEYADQVKVFSHEDPVGELLEEIQKMDLKNIPILTN